MSAGSIDLDLENQLGLSKRDAEAREGGGKSIQILHLVAAAQFRIDDAFPMEARGYHQMRKIVVAERLPSKTAINRPVFE